MSLDFPSMRILLNVFKIFKRPWHLAYWVYLGDWETVLKKSKYMPPVSKTWTLNREEKEGSAYEPINV